MFASQLLRLLQTLPADVNNESSVFDTAEEKPTMNGNQNGILSHSNGYKEADSLGFPVNDFGNTNVHDNREDPLACDRKNGNEFWKVPELNDSIFFDNNNEIKASNVRDDHNVDLSTINGDSRGGNPFACDITSSETNEIVAASVTDDQNGSLSNIIHSKRGGNPFECDTKDRDQPWNIPEYESLGFLDDKENETIDSDLPFTSHSELFENNKHFYSDKGVTDHELPELTQSNTRKSVDMGSTIVSVSFKDAKNIAVTHDTEIEVTGAPVPNGFNLSLENNANNDADKDSYLEDLLMIFGSKCTTNASEKPSSPNTVVRVEESNIKTSDGDQSTLQPDQVPSEQTLKSQTAVSAPDQTNNKGNSKEGVGTSIFDFNLTKPESTKTTEGGVGNLPEDSHMPKAVSVHKNGNSDNNSASSQVPFANTADNAHQQHLESQNMANGQGHFADGEASFSAARGPISGSITYSGPISYSEAYLFDPRAAQPAPDPLPSQSYKMNGIAVQ
ncbi:hypothetical protein H5410_064134 [Solanum commersonii]|uniref:Uncharacterized protein n=1 Tax=Solanum commersonii TaxID=4109 RepID=A0A9J5W0G8_SOLCO|nr:hypothetical protein H5410_064134 [Solanum commersonii]